MSKSKEPEKRRSSRKSHDSVLELLDESGNRIAGIGRLVDVSATGLCFSSTRTHQRGERLSGRLRLLKQGITIIRGHVIWSRRKTNRYLIGIAIDHVRPDKPR